MPGSVANAVAVTVLPSFLCRAFAQAREYAAQVNEYANGEGQRSLQSLSSRKTWEIQGILTATDLTALRAFYDARGGPLEAFYFYDFWESTPPGNYDATGVSTNGRFTVHFVGGFSQTNALPRSEAQIQLQELA